MRIKTDKNDKEWFCGRDVCLILGFQNISVSLSKKVKEGYKCSLKSLEYLTDYVSSVSYHEGRAVFICFAEPGAHIFKEYYAFLWLR